MISDTAKIETWAYWNGQPQCPVTPYIVTKSGHTIQQKEIQDFWVDFRTKQLTIRFRQQNSPHRITLLDTNLAVFNFLATQKLTKPKQVILSKYLREVA
jgi:hypothetical protein